MKEKECYNYKRTPLVQPVGK